MALKIMAVDDDPSVLNTIKALVEALGYEVLALSDSRVAAERVAKQKIDAALIDAKMPHLDGFELVKHIRASPSNSRVPIVMISGRNDVETMREGFKAGVTFFLPKPFKPEKLRGLIQAMRNAMLKEKRRYARLPIKTPVSCRCGAKQFQSKSVNISEGGILLESSGGLDVGQETELQFVVLQVPKPLKPRGRVVRKDPPDLLAILFVNLTPEDGEALRSVILGRIKD